jgi:hypothetical protein
MRPHPEWAAAPWTEDCLKGVYAAGIPRELRVFYYSCLGARRTELTALEPDVRYTASFFDPVDCREIPVGPVASDAEGRWRMPVPEVMHDYAVVLRAD